MVTGIDRVVEALLALDDPSVSLALRRGVLDGGDGSLEELGERVRHSRRARALLDGVAPGSVYQKWRGAHWVLSDLADLGYPPGAGELAELGQRVVGHWLSAEFYQEYRARSAASAYGRAGVPVLEGRHRRCASQQGNALQSIVRLGLAEDRAGELAERLVHWQWPDGGWNCDRNPSADTSSFMETLLPMRGLLAYAAWSGDEMARAAARYAAEVFLSRDLFRRRRDGQPMQEGFLKLHHPPYWHYDLLGGLVAMPEMDLLDDPRCAAALDLLESKRLEDGGWPAEANFYSTGNAARTGVTAVDWGGTSRRTMNPWVTVQALTVLVRAGRVQA